MGTELRPKDFKVVIDGVECEPEGETLTANLDNIIEELAQKAHADDLCPIFLRKSLDFVLNKSIKSHGNNLALNELAKEFTSKLERRMLELKQDD